VDGGIGVPRLVSARSLGWISSVQKNKYIKVVFGVRAYYVSLAATLFLARQLFLKLTFELLYFVWILEENGCSSIVYFVIYYKILIF
jgi:hypothetical protein